MTKLTKDNYPDTAIDTLEEIIEHEKSTMELKQNARTLPNNKYSFLRRTVFDNQISLHKERIRALKYAIGVIQRNEVKDK